MICADLYYPGTGAYVPAVKSRLISQSSFCARMLPLLYQNGDENGILFYVTVADYGNIVLFTPASNARRLGRENVIQG